MAMTAYYMGNTGRRHGAPTLVKTDKNGTEHWTDANCPKCGGSGYLPGYEFIDGARCWKCGATGYHPHSWKVMTPEYRAKLDAKRVARLRAKNLAERNETLERFGFGPDGKTYVVTGKTFEIKDELKAAGAVFCQAAGWHFAEKPEAWATIELTADGCFEETMLAELRWKEDLQERIQERTPREPSSSEYIGEVGKRMTVTLTLKKTFSFDSDYGTQYIHSFEDDDGNVVIWKTTNDLVETEYPGNGTYIDHTFIKGEITGTVKEHSEYRGVKQTELTRCKVGTCERA